MPRGVVRNCVVVRSSAILARGARCVTCCLLGSASALKGPTATTIADAATATPTSDTNTRCSNTLAPPGPSFVLTLGALGRPGSTATSPSAGTAISTRHVHRTALLPSTGCTSTHGIHARDRLSCELVCMYLPRKNAPLLGFSTLYDTLMTSCDPSSVPSGTPNTSSGSSSAWSIRLSSSAEVSAACPTNFSTAFFLAFLSWIFESSSIWRSSSFKLDCGRKASSLVLRTRCSTLVPLTLTDLM
mmetsp:Transcript_48961/g.156766  ORF Transcript_48961/g.156766 Transcript_48961/m.156766 type:complete len:244 (+) Transcript_48961:1067-1798(+)